MAGHPAWPAGRVTVARVNMIGHVAQTQIVTTWHFGIGAPTTDAATQTALQTLLTSIDANVRVAYLGCKPQDYVLDVIRGQAIQRATVAHLSLAPLDQVPTTTAGTVVANASSLTDCVVLKMRTALGGKHHRGRNYIGPIWPNVLPVEGVLTDATSKGYFNALITALNTYKFGGTHYADGSLGIYSRPLHAGEQQWAVRVGSTLTVRSNAAAYTGDFQEVTSMVYDWTLRELHRREVGVGS
jgi:hypothetical protein